MSPAEALFLVYVWPEPRSSAAGVRTLALMEALLRAGWKVRAVSPSGPSAYSAALNQLGVETLTCDPNQSAPTEEALRGLVPSLIVYDRFVMEEQFGWRLQRLFPQAFHLVDTQDLHSLRRARERKVRAGEMAPLHPTPAEMGEDLIRELSALYRADAALVVSSFEEELLLGLGFPRGSLLHLPFPAEADPAPIPFSERSGFCFLGNFRHPPNLDGVRWLVQELWPEVRKRLPAAELHLYGAYPPEEISRHKGAQGIRSHGPVADHRAALRSHRALLSPLRFGAGIKGKVLEAWGCGTPVIGTALSFEGIGHNGLLAETKKSLVDACVELESETRWQQASLAGHSFVREHFASAPLASRFLRFAGEGMRSLEERRKTNLVGAMLRHHQARSTEYFSRWIEGKNKNHSNRG